MSNGNGVLVEKIYKLSPTYDQFNGENDDKQWGFEVITFTHTQKDIEKLSAPKNCF